MMDKKHLERVLRVNGASLDSTDEEIRTLLLNARYTNQEVLIALQVLRKEVSEVADSVSELNRVFRSDTVLNSGEISRLLGITVDTSKQKVESSRVPSTLSALHYIIMVVLAILLSLGGLAALMYAFEFGIFHTTSAMQLYDGA